MIYKNPLSYPGNKNKLLKEIIPFLFESEVFVDVFCGSGVVGINSLSEVIFLNDINEWAIDILKLFYTTPFDKIIEELEKRIYKYNLTYSRVAEKGKYVEKKHEGLSIYNKEGFKKLKYNFNKENNIYDLIVLCIYSFNHYMRFNKKNEFNVPVGKVDFSQSIYEQLKRFVSLLQSKKVFFSNFDFRNEKLYEMQNAIYYFDPPYLITTAPYNNSWTADEEAELLELLDKLNGQGKKFVLSNVLTSNGKKNELLIEWSKKYRVINMKRQYRNANYQKINVSDSQEVIILNY